MPEGSWGFDAKDLLPVAIAGEPLLAVVGKTLCLRLASGCFRGHFHSMTLMELREEVTKLSFTERAELSRLLHGWEDDDWDRQIAKDAAAGALDDIVTRSEADMINGRFRPLP